MKLGSLFDGIGTFPLSASQYGIKPVWASEIEPFPIKVTQHHFPDMEHLGDITMINGAEIEPVDIITLGSPCQDLSIAGKRKGLEGERSGLFMDAVKRIREMRGASEGKYPRFAVWENVPGAYSSNKGQDFRAVLEEITETEIPMPASGKWATAGMVRTGNRDVAWRTLDAQHWGVPQRRKRIFLVADFGGQCAGEILFESSCLRGDSAESGFPRQATAGGIAVSSGSTVSVLNDQGGSYMDISENITGTLRSQEHGHQPIVFEPGAASRIGGHCWQGEPTGALCTGGGITGAVSSKWAKGTGGNNVPIVPQLYDMTHAEEVMRPVEPGIAPTLNSRMGTGGNQVPVMLHHYAVRRLVPLECERLMGLPDNWTNIEGASDTARYKAIGNGIAKPCSDFVIGRIAEICRRV